MPTTVWPRNHNSSTTHEPHGPVKPSTATLRSFVEVIFLARNGDNLVLEGAQS